MPIRINLLAEQQAAEEQRRRDPVTRATWTAGLIVTLLVVWAGFLQSKLLFVQGRVRRVEADWKTFEKDYSAVTTNIDRTADAERRFAALQSLATNRFLWAPALNALQYVLVDDVQLVRLKTEQSYLLTEAVKPSTNRTGVASKGKPATSREKVLLTIEARDSSSKPGDQILRFQEKLNAEPYFKSHLQKSELTGRSPVQADPANPSRPFVQFTVECQFPEKVR